MKVALVHEFLITWGGSDFVLEKFHEIFPEAPIYTALYDKKTMPDRFKSMDIKTSFLQKIPFSLKKHRTLLPLFPLAFEQFDLRDYNLVLSSHHSCAKSIITTPSTCHICFCHTPMRYGWDLYHSYLSETHLGISSKLILRNLRPTGVTRGSFFCVHTGPVVFSASTIIVLNLIKSNSRPSIPNRFCLKKIGPFESNLIINTTIIAIGLKKSKKNRISRSV